jgi:putative ABC transport system permease protein
MPEIAVQKVVGATRRQLVAQYGLESLLLAGLALVVALAVAVFVLTSVSGLSAVGFHPRLLLTPGLWASAISGVILVVLIAGAYPALRVAGRSLTGMMRPMGATGYSRRLRSLLVGTQFVLSGALLILAAFIVLQHRTMLSQAPNASLDPVFVLKGLSSATADELDAFEAALGRHGSVEATTRTKLIPWELSSEAIALWRAPDTSAPFVALNRIAVGYDYFDVMKIPLIAGRTFSPEYASDLYPVPEEIPSARGPYSVVIDEDTAARLGWQVPEQALGEVIHTGYLPPIVDEPRFVPLTVVGVVANRTLEIAAIGYAPTHAFTLSPREANNILVRPRPGAVAAALAHVDRQWSAFYPLSKAAPEFIEDVFRRSYSVIDRIGSTFVVLAVFVFVVSAVGLLSIAAFIVGLRQREVAIRRVLGASKGRVLSLLLRDFSKPVLVANLIAWPLGFVLASVYLSIFYVRTDAIIAPFALSFTLSVGVAVLTAAYQARRTANSPPATILKHE